MALHFLPVELDPTKGEEKIIHRRNKSGRKIKPFKPGRKRDQHGMTGTPEHTSWLSMIQRCYDPNCKAYPRYGGRGITVCDRWRYSFRNFYEDMGPCDGATLDRLNGNGIYEKDNCKWATYTQQNRNKSDNRYLAHEGRTMLIADWAREYGIRRNTLTGRLDDGWPVEMALTTPIQTKGNPDSPEARRNRLCRERKKMGIVVTKGGRRPTVTSTIAGSNCEASDCNSLPRRNVCIVEH